MRGRLAVECHYSQEYIDGIEMPDVIKMSEYWQLEPPFSMLYRTRFFEAPKGTNKKDMTIFPQTGAGRPWTQQPEHVKAAIIGHYLEANPSKTAEDFEKERSEEIKKRYADKLAAARANKGKQ